MDRLSNVLTLFSLGLIVAVLGSLRRAHIRVEYSVSWLAAGVAMLILSRSQALMRWLARTIGVGDPPLALILAVLVVFLLVFYRFSVTVSTLKDANIALAQRVAILEYHLRSQHESRQA
ncbi:MAG: DUF2304 domain-containing protein [Bryobacterales bacterium]|nr:DUF2304 domain-containing protein [Bryobacterales bacterium]